ncbi:hypothetical protein F5050DRAFT_272550 [Lentinula boryana]|uniref:Uncharacterized protein n=1 Tax=Lentinula boryana TaxID=40481 RepID=A0ABQ8QAS4_9AGAR|nr:hypothetical protein F5050DRAFT_272550 [Lentinula boryana]
MSFPFLAIIWPAFTSDSREHISFYLLRSTTPRIHTVFPLLRINDRGVFITKDVNCGFFGLFGQRDSNTRMVLALGNDCAVNGVIALIHDPEKSVAQSFMARTKVEIVIPSRNSAGYTRTVWGAIIPPSSAITQMNKESLSKIKCTNECRPTKRIGSSAAVVVKTNATRQPARACRKAKD